MLNPLQFIIGLAQAIANTSQSRHTIVLITLTSAFLPSTAPAQDSPRERISLNLDWRFQKDDPSEVAAQLDYSKIRNWFMATGNEFTLSPGAATHPRPAGKLGEGITYTQSSFDESGWRKLNLPHDWGIEGPFKQEYPGETGKLAWWGVGWYRKHFDLPETDKDRQVFLDLDGAMAYSLVWLNGQFVGGWPY